MEKAVGGLSQATISFSGDSHKARADIEAARSAIQTLSPTATPTELAALPNLAKVSAEQDDGTIEVDPREENLQDQLQSVFQSCATSIEAHPI